MNNSEVGTNLNDGEMSRRTLDTGTIEDLCQLSAFAWPGLPDFLKS